MGIPQRPGLLLQEVKHHLKTALELLEEHEQTFQQSTYANIASFALRNVRAIIKIMERPRQ